VVADALRKRQ